MPRRALSSALLGLSALAAAAAVAAPAQAAEGDTCVLTPPARVVISSQYTELPASVSGDCASTSDLEAFWYSKVADENKYGGAVYFSAYEDAVVVFDNDDQGDGSDFEFGVNQWLPERVCQEVGDDCNDIPYSQSATGPSDVRGASTAGAVGRRSHGTVTLTGPSAAYSLIAHKQARRSVPAYWQYQDKTTVPFRTFRTVTTTSAGATTVTVQGQPVGRRYRLLLGATPTSWSSASKTVAP